MKRKLSILMVVTLILSLCLGYSSYAFGNDNINKSKVVVNEYLKLKNLKKLDRAALKKAGYSDKAIDVIKKLDYVEVLKQRSQLDDFKLKNMGYTDEQITMLNNFNGAEDEVIALAATLSLNAYENFYYYDSVDDRTYFHVEYYWIWSSKPIICLEDIIGIGWSEEFYLVSPNDAEHFVHYKDLDTGETTTRETPLHEDSATGAISFTFDVVKYSYSSPQVETEWSESGYGDILISKAYEHPECKMKVAYGHSILETQPSLGYPLNVGFTFVGDVNEEDYKTVYATI